MVFGPYLRDQIHQEICNHKAQDRTHHWGHVEGCEVAKVEVVCWNDQERNGRIVSDRPANCKRSVKPFSATYTSRHALTIEEVEQTGQRHREFPDCKQQSTTSSEKGVAGIVLLVLLNTDESKKTVLALGNLIRVEVARVKRFFAQQNGQGQTQCNEAKVEIHPGTP